MNALFYLAFMTDWNDFWKYFHCLKTTVLWCGIIVSPKRWYLHISPHGVTTHNIVCHRHNFRVHVNYVDSLKLYFSSATTVKYHNIYNSDFGNLIQCVPKYVYTLQCMYASFLGHSVYMRWCYYRLVEEKRSSLYSRLMEDILEFLNTVYVYLQIPRNA